MIIGALFDGEYGIEAALLPTVTVTGALRDREYRECEIAAALLPTVTVNGALLEGEYGISI